MAQSGAQKTSARSGNRNRSKKRPLDEEGIIKEIRKNNAQAKVKVTEFKVAQEDILGIPRDVFNAVAVKVERPLSKQ